MLTNCQLYSKKSKACLLACLFVYFCFAHILQTATIQHNMKLKEILQDSMPIVGCVVGVSFVTGKEAQVFVGNGKNIALFAIVFGCATLLLRLFCAKYKLQNTQQFALFCFDKWGYVVYFAMIACFFVCLVTTLATVQSCLNLLVARLPFAMWSAVVVLLSAVVLKWGNVAFRVVCTLAFVGAFATFLFVSSSNNLPLQMDVKPLSTLMYCLFSLTMVLPVCCQTKGRSATQNAICVAVATIVVALLLWWVERVADFSLALPIGTSLQGVGKVCLCLTVALCGMSGVIGNALPILQSVSDILPNNGMRTFVVLSLGWAFSCLGLDVFLKYGYMFVALVGLLIVVRCVAKMLTKKPR